MTLHPGLTTYMRPDIGKLKRVFSVVQACACMLLFMIGFDSPGMSGRTSFRDLSALLSS